MRIIGYARISDLREDSPSSSLARQHEAIAAKARASGWQLVRIVDDVSVSASKARLDRPGLDEIRTALKTGEADAVCVWRLDRLARSVVDFGLLLDDGVDVVSATEPLDTTSPMGRAMAEILQVFAAMESSTIAARVSSSVNYLRRNARFPGGTVPFGYRSIPHPDGVGRALELDPDTAPIVREAAERYLGGESLTAIASDLTMRGVPTSQRASGWSVQALRSVLSGDAVLGRVRHGGRHEADGKRVRGDLVRGDDGLPLEVWPPILTVEESAEIRARLESNKRPGAARRKAARLLSGFARCGTCGSTLYVNGQHFRCTAKSHGGVCAAPVSASADLVEEHVVDRFLARFGTFDVVEERVVSAAPVGLAAIEEAIASTTDAMREPGADLAALVARLEDLRSRRETIAALPSERRVERVATGRTFAEEWEAREAPGRRRLLASVLDAVRISPSNGSKRWQPERVAIEWAHEVDPAADVLAAIADDERH